MDRALCRATPKERPAVGFIRPAVGLAACARIEEELSERLCQNGLELWHDCLNLRGDHVGFEGSLVDPAFEGKKTPRLADHLRNVGDLANVTAYVRRIEQRPAYIKAMQIARPKAAPPT
jgi:hypothetical protein